MSSISKAGAGKTALALLFSSAIVVSGATAIVPAVSAQPVAEAQAEASDTTTKTYADGASVTVPTTVTEGGVLHLEGKDFFTADKSQGSLIAVKLDNGGVSRNELLPGQSNATIWQLIDVDATGAFSVDVPLPTTEDSNIKEGAWDVGTEHDVVLLTGSLRDGDAFRGGTAAKYTIVADEEPEEPSDPTVTTTVTTTVTQPPVTTTVPTTVSTTVPTTVTKPPVTTTVVTTVNNGEPTTVTTTVDRPTTKTETVTKTVTESEGGGSSDGAGDFGSLALTGLGGFALGGLLVGALSQAVANGVIVLPEPFAGMIQQFTGNPAGNSQVPVN